MTWKLYSAKVNAPGASPKTMTARATTDDSAKYALKKGYNVAHGRVLDAWVEIRNLVCEEEPSQNVLLKQQAFSFMKRR